MTPSRRATALLLLVLAVLLSHWPTGRVDFVYDDEEFIVANPAAHSVAAAAHALLEPFPPDQPGRGLYRPVTGLSYGVDFTLWGGRARGFALTNVALYLAVVLLAWQLFNVQLASPSAAFAAALLFAVHPVHAEAVDAIAGRSELLALLLALLSILAHQRALASLESPGGPGVPRAAGVLWYWSLASALAYALACGAKETAVVLPGILAALAVLRCLGDGVVRPRWRLACRTLLPHLFAFAAYVVLRRVALGGFIPERTTLGGVDLAGRILTAGAVFLEYLRLLLFPALLQVDGYYLFRVGIVREPTFRALVGLALLASLLVLAAALAARLIRGAASGAASPPAAAAAQGALLGGLAIFLIFLLPVSHILPMGALMAERFLFAPSLGFVLAAAAAVLLLGQRFPSLLCGRRSRALRLAGALVLALLVVLGGWRSRARSLEWRDAVRLWASADRMIPGSSLVKTNLGAELLLRGDLDGAGRALRAALSIRPGGLRAAFNLALVAARSGDLTLAAALLEDVVRQNPGDAGALIELAGIEAGRSNPERARSLLDRARPLTAGRSGLERKILAIEEELGKEEP